MQTISTVTLIAIAIIVLMWSILDVLGFKYKVNKFQRVKTLDAEQELRFDWLSVLLSSIRTHDQLCEFHLILEKTLKPNDYHSMQYITLKQRIEAKEMALRKLRIKEGENILNTVKI